MDVAAKAVKGAEVKIMYSYRGGQPFTEEQRLISKNSSDRTKKALSAKGYREPWNKGMTGLKYSCTICREPGHYQQCCPTLVTVRVI